MLFLFFHVISVYDVEITDVIDIQQFIFTI